MLRTTLKNCWEAVRATLRLLGRHRSMGIAAEMSFWLFCALIPLSFTAVIILAHLPEKGTSLLEALFAEAPDATRALVGEEVAALSHSRVQPSLLNLVVFVWLASSGLHAIYDGFEAQLGIVSPWWKKRLRALLGCAVLSCGVALLALFAALFAHLSGIAPWLAGPRLGLVLRSAGSLLVLCGLTAGLYRLGVPTSARIHVGLLPGTLAVVFLIGVLGFGYRTYLATLGDGSVYQAGLSVVVVTLTALFLFSLAMLLGLAINQQIARRIKHETGPVGLPRSDRSDPGAELQPLGVEKTTDSQIPGPAPEPTQNQSAQLDGDARRGAAADLRCDVYSSPEKALRFSALFAVAIILFIAHPMGIGVLLGTLTAFSLSPFYLRLVTRWERPVLAALFCVGLTILGGAAVFAGFGYLLIGRGIGLLRGLAAGLSPGGAVRNFFESINARLPLFGVHPGTLAQHIGNAAAEISERLADIASRVAGAAFSGLLALFFLFITAYFVLQNWSSLTRRAEIMLPLKPRDTRALFDEFRRVGRSVLLGTVLTGMAQGLLAFIGYYLTRIPEAAFFGALTAVASLVPGVGTLLVWVPLGVYLLITGHVVLGVIELLYGAFVVGGLCDYVLRPRLVGGHGDMPALLTFLALFGALKVFGLIGLILGPVIMSLAVALLRIYEREATLRRAAEVSAISTDCLDPL